ncbi:hypothetical protein ACFFLS_23920 [Flavobacterium procerum]|uniref:Lipoprotein n=1 Tax=Flavobacterium procerum TaxID=1455569 RepID=A0ABV6BYK3_9FLAO
MKKLIFLGALTLLCNTLFSCTADEFETQTKKESKKEVSPTYAGGPGDIPVPPPPPPPEDE